jgi:hypothetical protein
MLGGEDLGGGGAVEDRHVQVEQDRVGLVLGDKVDGLLPVGCCGDDLDAGRHAEQQDEAFPHAGLVVGDDDPQNGGPGSAVGSHRGTCAVTVHWPLLRPPVSVPSSISRRSRIPTSPYPPSTVLS